MGYPGVPKGQKHGRFPYVRALTMLTPARSITYISIHTPIVRDDRAGLFKFVYV